MKRKVVSILIITILLSVFLTSMLYANTIGDEPSEQHNLIGDIKAEKEIEEKMYPFVTLEVKDGQLVITDKTSSDLLWQNWPFYRWAFDISNPESGWSITQISKNVAAETMVMFANILLFLAALLTKLGITFCGLAFNSSILAGLADWIGSAIKNMYKLDSGMSDIVWLMITWGIIVLLIYAVFYFIKGRFVSIINALGVAIGMVALTILFSMNASQIIKTTAEYTDAVAGVFLAAIAEYKPLDKDIDPVNQGIITFGETAWRAIIAYPWAMTLFGTIDTDELRLTQDEYNKMDKSYFSSGVIQPGMRIDTLFLGTMGEPRQALVDVLVRPDVDHGNHPGTMIGMHVDNALKQVMIAFLMLSAAFAFFALASMTTVYILFAQLMLGALLILFPAMLLLAIIPEFGWAVTANYFKILLKFLFIKMIYGVYLALVLVTTTAFSETLLKQEQVGLALLFIIIIFTAAIFFRSKFFEAFGRQLHFPGSKDKLGKLFKVAKAIKYLKLLGLAGKAGLAVELGKFIKDKYKDKKSGENISLDGEVINPQYDSNYKDAAKTQSSNFTVDGEVVNKTEEQENYQLPEGIENKTKETEQSSEETKNKTNYRIITLDPESDKTNRK